MEKYNELFVVSLFLFALYMLVLLMVGADLWSGVRKAKLRGETRTSYGLRKTVSKLTQYYNILLALTVVDCMQMGGFWYLDSYYDYHVPIFPVITLIGAIGIGIIEIKSIYEKAEDKVKSEYQEVAILAAHIAKNRDNPEDIAKVVMDYIQNSKNQSGKGADNG